MALQSKVEELTSSSVLGALTFALDVTEGAEPGHALRTCMLGMRIGREMQLDDHQLSDLYYALLLKDAGCSSNAARLHQIIGGDEIQAKAFTKKVDWTKLDLQQVEFLFRRVHAGARVKDRVRAMWAMVRDSKTNGEALIRLRCHEGATVVRDLGIGDGAAEAIYNLDEHWNGAGYPDHLVGEQIPLLARIVSVAQTLDVFLTTYGNAAAMACVKQRSGRWYDPAVVQAALGLGRSGLLWREIRSPHLQQMVVALEPQSRSLPTDEGSIDLICAAFAKVVDAKSHSTYRHSTEVARIACELGTRLGVGAEEMVTLRRAALLHDIGKLSVPNSILDKPGKLTAEEWMCVKRHPEVTEAILARIPTFAEITRIAASHHEKLDGSGYHRGVSGDQLCLLSRVLTTSDVFEALSGIRSYRESLPLEKVMAIMREDVPHKLDAECFCALGEITAARGPVAMGSLATA